MTHSENNSNLENKVQKYGNVTLGLNMAAGIVVFTGLGYLIDEKRGGGQAFTLAGIFLGLFYCAYEVWKVIRNNENP